MNTLTEDQDIGLQLLEAGWRGAPTRCAQPWPSQGVSDLRRLYRQRTRWSQGNLQAMSHLSKIKDVRCSTVQSLISSGRSCSPPPLQAIVGLATIVALFFAIFLGTPFISEGTQWAWLWLVFLFFLGGVPRSDVWQLAEVTDSWAT